MFKDIYKLAMGILLIVTGVMVIVASVQLLNIGLDQILGVENCIYERVGKLCKPDINGIKKDIAQALALLIIASPTAWFAHKVVRSA